MYTVLWMSNNTGPGKNKRSMILFSTNKIEDDQKVAWNSPYGKKKMHMETAAAKYAHRNQDCKTLALHALPGFWKRQKIRACVE